MVATVTKVGNTERHGGVLRTRFTIAFTATYTTNGDTLDLTTVCPATDLRQPKVGGVTITGLGGLFIYTYSPGTTTCAAGKVRIWTNSAGGSNSILTEMSNAAHVAGASSDTITGVAEWSADGLAV